MNKQDIKIISATPVYEITTYHQGLRGYDIKYTYKGTEGTIRVDTTTYVFGEDEIKNKIVEMYEGEIINEKGKYNN